MVMINKHIAYITCLVTNDLSHAYDIIEVYKIHHAAGLVHIYQSGQYCGWLVWSSAGSGPVTFSGASNTVVGLHSYGRDRGPLQGAFPPG